MKSLFLLVVVWMPFSALYAQIYVQENFDSLIPPAWTIIDGGQSTGDSWVSGTVAGNNLNGSACALVNSDANGNGTHLIETLISPVFDASAASSLFLDFEQYYRFSFVDSALVEVYDGSQWQILLSQTANSVGAFNNPDQQHIDISAYKNAQMQIRFRYNDNNSWARYWLIDNVQVYNSNCVAPINFTATDLSPSTIQLDWTSNGTTTNWLIEWGPQGFSLGNGNDTVVGTAPFVLDSLNPATDYSFYIRSLCLSGDSSTWIGPLLFSTACTAINLPFLENVELHMPNQNLDTSLCWQQISSGNYDWNIDGSGSTPSSGTGPSVAYSGNNYFYVEASGGNPGDQTLLISPYIDLNNSLNPALEFYYHMYGVKMGDLFVDVLSNQQWINVDSINGQQQNSSLDAWHKKQINLSAFSGFTKIRFRAQSKGVFQGDIALDDIQFIELNCYEPQNVTLTNLTDTSAQINWTEIGTALQWELSWGPSGFAPGSAWDTILNNSYGILRNLQSDNDYEFYVRSFCNNTDSSNWVGPFEFRTKCSAFFAPWFENIESHNQTIAFINSNCWTTQNNSSTTLAYNWNIDGGGSTPTNNTGPLVPYSGSNYFYTEASNGQIADETYLYFPMIDISGLSDPAFQFYFHMYGSQIGQLYLEQKDSTQWLIIDSLIGQQQTVQIDKWRKRQGPIPNDQSQIELRFRAVSAGTALGDIAIDDISIDNISCFDPSPPELIYSNHQSLQFYWDDQNQSALWQIEYGPQGFFVGTGNDTLTSLNTLNLDSLAADRFYDIYLRSVCDSVHQSTWIGPFSFKTRCSPQMAPWIDSIELHNSSQNFDFSSCWKATNEAEYYWNVIDSGSTPTPNTGPAQASSGQRYFYIESSNSQAGQTAYLYWPLINLDSLFQPTVQYQYFLYGSDIGQLYLEYYEQGNWIILDSISGSQQGSDLDSWLQKTVYLDSVPQLFELRFRAVSVGGDLGDIALDQLSIEEAPPADIGLELLGLDTILCRSSFDGSRILIKNLSPSNAQNIPYILRYNNDTLLQDTLAYLEAWTIDTLSLSFIQADTGFAILDVFLQNTEDPNLSNDSILHPLIHSYTQANITLLDSLICSNDSSAVILGLGSQGVAFYNYQWLNQNNNVQIDTLSGLSEGLYTLIVTDSVACADTASISLIPQFILSIQDSITDLQCYNDSSGAIQLNLTGGNPPYSYWWDYGASGAQINGLQAGIYPILIQDSIGCLLNDSFAVSEPTALSVQILDNGNGTATVQASGANGNYSYLWDANANNQTSSTASGLFNNSTYYVTVSDSNNCSQVDSITVNWTSISSVFEAKTISFPNPSKGVFYVQISYETTNALLSIRNQIGQLIYRKQVSTTGKNKYLVELKDPLPGLYYLHIQSDKAQFIQKHLIID